MKYLVRYWRPVDCWCDDCVHPDRGADPCLYGPAPRPRELDTTFVVYEAETKAEVVDWAGYYFFDDKNPGELVSVVEYTGRLPHGASDECACEI